MIVNGNLTEINQVVFVVGDVMLDKYLLGIVNRISPEAPVPVLDVNKKSDRPGGAANVALNLFGLQHIGLQHICPLIICPTIIVLKSFVLQIMFPTHHSS